MVNSSWQSVEAILEDISVFDAKISIQRLSSFSVPKIMALRHP